MWAKFISHTGSALQPVVPQHAHVQLATIDVALDDGLGADTLVDEPDALAQGRFVLDNRRLRDADRGLLRERLDDERERQPFPDARQVAHPNHGELGGRNAVIREQRLREGFVARQHQPARVASRVRRLHQLEVADHVLIEHADLAEALHEIEDDARPKSVIAWRDDAEIVLDADLAHLCPMSLRCETTSNSIFQGTLTTSTPSVSSGGTR